MKTNSELLSENVAKAVSDGPRFRVDYNIWVVAKDSKNLRVKLGGLGCMGIGEMWFQDEPRYAEYPGYKEAPEQDSPDPSQPLLSSLIKELEVLDTHNQSKSVM